MGFWKNLGIFNFLTSKDSNDKLMSLYLVASEEEKERNNKEKIIAPVDNIPFDAENMINTTSDRLVTFRVNNKKYLSKKELNLIDEYLDKLHTCPRDRVPTIRYDAEQYLSYLEKKVNKKSNKQ